MLVIGYWSVRSVRSVKSVAGCAGGTLTAPLEDGTWGFALRATTPQVALQASTPQAAPSGLEAKGKKERRLISGLLPYQSNIILN